MVLALVAAPAAQAAGLCPGDCNGDGVVMVDELMRGVNIGLDSEAVSTCSALDTDRSGAVTVAELVRALNQALRGCGYGIDPAFLVRDVRPGPEDSEPTRLLASRGHVYFSADDGVVGRELWVSDGTGAGTRLVDNLAPDQGSSNPQRLTRAGDRLFFQVTSPGSEELWVSDGTADGTMRLLTAPQTGLGAMLGVGETLFFAFDDGEHGAELWKSDGTLQGTVMVKDINPGSDGSRPDQLTNVNGTLFFTAFTVDVAREVWRSDGSADGTVLVKDTHIDASPHDNNLRQPGPAELTDIDGILWFTHPHADGTTVWRSDGTEAGTVRVRARSGGNHTHGPNRFTELHGLVYFAAGSSLWRSDGTDDGTERVVDVSNNGFHGPDITGLIRAGNLLYFTIQEQVNQARRPELWVSDGSAAGTRMLELFRSTSAPPQLVPLGGIVLFAVDDGEHGVELWRSSGTRESTRIVADVFPGPGGSISAALTGVGNKVFFQACTPSGGCELWTSDGTGEGTRRAADIFPGPLSSNPLHFTFAGDLL